MSKDENGGEEITDKDLERLRQEIEAETRARDSMEWANQELERNVKMMERNVQQLEMGNIEGEDSEPKQKYESQKQMNAQLLEQKKWLEHELEEIKLKIQNDKIHPVPDMLLDWDKLSETELKRLVVQLEKTRNDLKSDIMEVEYRLDKEGKEYHHHEEFAKAYRAEVISLTRTLDQLTRHGAQIGVPLPGLPGSLVSGDKLKDGLTPLPSQLTTTGGWVPGGYPVSKKHSELVSSPPPTRKGANSPSPNRKTSNNSPSPSRLDRKSSRSPSRKNSETGPTTKIDPKLGTQRKTAGVRNLPKIDRNDKKKDVNGKKSAEKVSPKKAQKRSPKKTPKSGKKAKDKAEKGGEAPAENGVKAEGEGEEKKEEGAVNGDDGGGGEADGEGGGDEARKSSTSSAKSTAKEP